jgi:outer membrane protein
MRPMSRNDGLPRRRLPVVSVHGAVVLAIAMAGSALAGQAVQLTPAKVVDLAQKQSVVAKASELSLKAQEAARKSAFTAFLPTVSANASAIHLIDKVSMFGSGSGSGSFRVFRSMIYDSMGTPLPPFDAGDGVLGTLLDTTLGTMFSSFSQTPDNIYNVGFTVSQPIFTGGKIYNAYRIADLTYKAQILTRDRTLEETGLTALQIYWGYVGALKQLEAIQETRSWFETLVKDQEKMYGAGLIIELDLLNSRIQLDNFKLGELKIQDAIRSVGSQMLLFIGLPTDGEISVDTADWADTQTPFAMPSADSIDSRLKGRRDLQALESQLTVLRCLKSIQTAAYSPTVAGFYSLGWNNQYSSDEKDLKRSQSIGAQLNWTLFDWGKGLRETEKVKYQISAMELQRDAMRDQLRLKIIDLAAAVDQSRRACGIAKDDAEIARKALEISKKKYDAQAITNTELLTARNQLTAKTVAYAQARINAIMALEEYKVAPLTAGQASSQSGQTSTAASPSGATGQSSAQGAGGGMGQ